MQNLNVQVGGSVTVKLCSDIEYGSFVSLMATDFNGDQLKDDLTEEIIRKSLFGKDQVPQMIGNKFSFEHLGKIIRVEVVDCHPEPYCLVGPVTKIKMAEQTRALEKKPIVVEYDAFGNGTDRYQDDEEFSYYSEYDERQDEILEDIIQPSKTSNDRGQESSFLDSSMSSVNGYVPMPRHQRDFEPVILNPRFNDPNPSFDYRFVKPKDAYKIALDTCEKMKEFYLKNPDLKPDKDYDQLTHGYQQSINDID